MEWAIQSASRTDSRKCRLRLVRDRMNGCGKSARTHQNINEINGCNRLVWQTNATFVADGLAAY